MDQAGNPEEEDGVITWSRDGWTLRYEDGLHIHPPEPFNYDTPRCPFTGQLYDEHGPVENCEHKWHMVNKNIRQCWKCKYGEELPEVPCRPCITPIRQKP
jgi:hypothetical protein